MQSLKLKNPSKIVQSGRVNLKKLELTTITQKVLIPASPKQVYDAYTDPKLHSEFTDAKASGKPIVGGKFTTWDGYIFGIPRVRRWQTTRSGVDYHRLGGGVSSVKVGVNFQSHVAGNRNQLDTFKRA
jgi:hypothetical protein